MFSEIPFDSFPITSNPGGGLPLLETFSRNTAKEFANAGYVTTAKFRDDVQKDELRRALPGCDIFLWEGHHSTLVREFKVPQWDEPTAPAYAARLVDLLASS